MFHCVDAGFGDGGLPRVATRREGQLRDPVHATLHCVTVSANVCDGPARPKPLGPTARRSYGAAMELITLPLRRLPVLRHLLRGEPAPPFGRASHA